MPNLVYYLSDLNAGDRTCPPASSPESRLLRLAEAWNSPAAPEVQEEGVLWRAGWEVMSIRLGGPDREAALTVRAPSDGAVLFEGMIENMDLLGPEQLAVKVSDPHGTTERFILCCGRRSGCPRPAASVAVAVAVGPDDAVRRLFGLMDLRWTRRLPDRPEERCDLTLTCRDLTDRGLTYRVTVGANGDGTVDLGALPSGRRDLRRVTWLRADLASGASRLNVQFDGGILIAVRPSCVQSRSPRSCL